ncbi:neutral amino acid transporter [Chytriomyces hyalinus]|nr:neutral amino acid transporter [Chytriomyces hyalinus]
MARGNKGKRGTPTRGSSGIPEPTSLGSTDPAQPDQTQQDPTAPTQPAQPVQPIVSEPTQPVTIQQESVLPERTPTPTPSRLIPTPHKRQSSADTKTHLAVSQPRSFKNASGLSNSFKANEALIEARLSEYAAIRSSSRSSTPALEQAAALLVEEHLVRPEPSGNNPEGVISSPTAHSLQGGAITSEIYQWAHNQRTVNTSSPTPTNASSTASTIRQHRRMNSMPDLQSAHLRNTPDILTVTQLREPGVFRRRFIAERLERAGKPVAFLTRNFIDFLALYGFYGGDIVPDETDDDLFDGTDEEGIEEFSRVGRPGSARRDSINRGVDDQANPDAINATESTPLMSNSYHASSGRGPGLVTAPNVKGTSAKKAFFMLMKSFVGTGVLFLPKAFSMGGMGFSIILMILFGWLTLHCMLLLLETSRSLGGSFGDIGEKLYGPPIRYLVLGSIAVSQAGFACAYYIFVSQNLRDLVMLASDCTIILPDWVFILLQIMIYVPLAWVRKIKYFSFTSLIADVFIMVGLVYIFYQDLFVLSTTGPSRDIIWFNLESFPIFIGTALFAFEGICLILPIAESMKHPEQFPMVLTLCITFIGTIFIVIGATGYLTFGNAVETIIFLNMPKDSRLVQTLQFFYAIAIILSFPLCVYPSIRITESAIFGLADGKSSMLVKWQKNLMRTIFVMFLAFVAWTGSSHLDKFVSLVGCFACIPLSFIYPSIFHYHITPNPWVKAKDIGIALFGLAALVYTTYITVSQWVGGSPDIPVDRCASRNGGF